MTIEELAAQRCADNWNELKVNGCTSWEASDFLTNYGNFRIQYRRLVERIHYAIEAFEAGDKDALEPFKLVEPVDPLLLEAREIVKEILDPICDCLLGAAGVEGSNLASFKPGAAPKSKGLNVTDNLDGLITMLLALEPRYSMTTGEHLYDVHVNRDGRKAVAAIQALKAERDALRAAIAWVNEVHPTNCDGYARVGMTFEEFAAMKAALQQKDRNDD